MRCVEEDGQIIVYSLSSCCRHAQAFAQLSTAWGCIQSGRDRRSRPSGHCASVVRHVSPDQVPGSQSTAQAELSSEHTGSDDTGQLPSIVAWVRGMGAPYAQELKKGALRLEDSATSNCADFNTRH